MGGRWTIIPVYSPQNMNNADLVFLVTTCSNVLRFGFWRGTNFWHESFLHNGNGDLFHVAPRVTKIHRVKIKLRCFLFSAKKDVCLRTVDHIHPYSSAFGDCFFPWIFAWSFQENNTDIRMDTFDSLKIVSLFMASMWVFPEKWWYPPPHFTPPKMIIFNRKKCMDLQKGCFPPFFGKKNLTYLDVDQPQDPLQH